MKTTQTSSNPVKGILFMFLSSLCSGLIGYLNKKLYLDSPGITPYEAVYWSSILNVIAYYCILR